MCPPLMLNHKEFITTYTRLQYLSYIPEIRLFLRDDKHLHSFLQQELNNNTPYPFWAYVWAGGLALARYIIDNPHIVRDRHVSDYCAGSGIVGIAASLSGAASVTCVDTDPIALSTINLNAKANGITINVSETLENRELVLAGDPALTHTVFDTLKSSDLALIGYPIRKEEFLVGFDIISSYHIINDEFINGAQVHVSQVFNKTR